MAEQHQPCFPGHVLPQEGQLVLNLPIQTKHIPGLCHRRVWKETETETEREEKFFFRKNERNKERKRGRERRRKGKRERGTAWQKKKARKSQVGRGREREKKRREGEKYKERERERSITQEHQCPLCTYFFSCKSSPLLSHLITQPLQEKVNFFCLPTLSFIQSPTYCTVCAPPPPHPTPPHSLTHSLNPASLFCPHSHTMLTNC